MEIRELSQDLFYDLINDVQWYLKRSDSMNLKEALEPWVIMISPFMPHYAEEFWGILGNKGLVCEQKFPKPNKKLIDEEIEEGEELIRQVMGDCKKIMELVGKKPKKIFVYCSSEWKHKLYEVIREKKKFEEVMKVCSKDSELK